MGTFFIFHYHVLVHMTSLDSISFYNCLILYITRQESEGQSYTLWQNIMTLKYDLDFEFTKLNHGLRTSTHIE